MALDTTVGGANADSYCSLADADAYHDARLYADTWLDAESSYKERALKMATRLLDQSFEWVGSAVGATQALLWPRVGAVGPTGYTEASDAIPARIRDATAELARQLLTEDRTTDSETETQGIKAVTAGSVKVEFSGTGGAKPIPDMVAAMVAIYGQPVGKRGAGAVTLRRA